MSIATAIPYWSRVLGAAYLMIPATLLVSSCTDSDDSEGPTTWEIGDPATTDYPEDYYAGGRLGTTAVNTATAFEQPTKAVEDAGMMTAFNEGEYLFEKDYNTNTEGAFHGLGPVYVRRGCLYCHPGYGHGARQTEYKADNHRNGYLLVVYDKTTNAYIRSVAGMPQTGAVKPFKAPIDESQISIEWKNVTEMESGLPMQFEDGEQYALIYPEVRIPQSAFNTNPKPENYDVRLESTIGVYGTGLLDAIDDEDIEAQWLSESKYVELNPAMWDKEAGAFKSSAYYAAGYNDTGTHRGSHGPLKKFTYAMTRGSLQDGAGANAIWNITNVTRSDRHWLYTTPAWAKAQSEDAEVIDYIKKHGASESSILHPYYADGTDKGIAERVNDILSCSSIAKKETFDKYLFNGKPYNGKDEMSDKQYYQFMVWHRGLAVPAARNLNDARVQRGKELFSKIGCAQCHRPSWTTGADKMWVDASIKAYAKSIGKDADKVLPKYPNQTIWPYTDMVQHRLFMKNDIRTGWCRTTPLWGRGLSRQLTGADDRLHDCRARTVLEAIMWHGYSKQSDGYRATEKFSQLPKEDRDAVIKFIESI